MVPYKNPTFVRMELAFIRTRRKGMGLSQEGLAKLTGIRRETIGLIEQGKTDPHLSTLVKIAKALECGIALVPYDCILVKMVEQDGEKRIAGTRMGDNDDVLDL